jgi:ABC-type uncharacterized transport system permease subunit
MRKRLSLVFWAESILACITGFLAALTAVWPDWIEAVTGFQPDKHNGSFEWMLVVGCGLAAVLLANLARHEWREAAIAHSA